MCSVRLREKIFVHREREGRRGKRRKIFGEGKCLSTEEKKKEEGKGGKYLEKDNIERRKIFGEGKHLVCVEDETGEGKGGNYSEKGN